MSRRTLGGRVIRYGARVPRLDQASAYLPSSTQLRVPTCAVGVAGDQLHIHIAAQESAP